jgi:hypothetical protein
MALGPEKKQRLVRAAKLLALQFLYVIVLYQAIIIFGYTYRILAQSFTNQLLAFFYVIGGSVLFLVMHILQPMGIVSYLGELSKINGGLLLWCVPIFLVALIHMIRNRSVNVWLKAILSVLLFATTISWVPIVAIVYLLWQVKEFSRITRIAACVASALLFLVHVAPNNFPPHLLTVVFYLFEFVAVVVLGLMVRDTIRNSRALEEPPSAETSQTTPPDVPQLTIPLLTEVASHEDADEVIQLPKREKQPEPKHPK